MSTLSGEETKRGTTQQKGLVGPIAAVQWYHSDVPMGKQYESILLIFLARDGRRCDRRRFSSAEAPP
jgi:hypothetical protein